MLNLTTFFVKKHVRLLRISNVYDIIDPATGQPVGIAREKPPFWVKIARLLVARTLLPTKVVVTGPEPAGATEFFSFAKSGVFGAKVRVMDAMGQKVGDIRSQIFSFRPKFRVFDANDQEIALIKGDWKGWNFRAEDPQGQGVGVITKKWAGIGKELFTSADNYIVQAEGSWGADRNRKILLLSTAFAIDIIYKTQN